MLLNDDVDQTMTAIQRQWSLIDSKNTDSSRFCMMCFAPPVVGLDEFAGQPGLKVAWLIWSILQWGQLLCLIGKKHGHVLHLLLAHHLHSKQELHEADAIWLCYTELDDASIIVHVVVICNRYLPRGVSSFLVHHATKCDNKTSPWLAGCITRTETRHFRTSTPSAVRT